ncbi:O-antigen ligase family protein [Deinococcus aerolatus]|nr:O-antigen ligase family protein [Deinococcus aerolatus]
MGVLFWRWRLGVYALMALLPFENIFVFGAFRGGLKVLIGTTVLAMLLDVYLRPSSRQQFQAVLTNKTFLLTVAFTAWAVFSTVWAVFPDAALSKSTSFVGVTTLVVLLGMLVPTQLKTAWTLLIIAGIISVIQGVAQGSFSDLNGRFIGAGEDPNEYAGLLLTLGAVVVYGRSKLKVWMFVPAVILLFGSLLTQSRAGLVALLATPLVALIILVLRRAVGLKTLSATFIVYIFAGILVISATALWPNLQSTLFSRASSLNNYADPDTWAGRLGIWAGGFRMWSEHKWLGVGAGNFGFLSPDYSLEAAALARAKGVAVAHNTYLSNLAELGVVGLGIFVCLMWTLISRTSRLAANIPFARAILVGSVVILVMAITLSLEYSKILYVLVGSQIALMISAEQCEIDV